MSTNFSVKNDQRTTNVDNADTVRTDTLIATNISSTDGTPLDVGFGQVVANTNAGTTTPDFVDTPAFTLSGTSVVLSEGDWKITFNTSVRAQTAAATAQRTGYIMGFTSDGTQISNGSTTFIGFTHQVDNPPGSPMEIHTDHYFSLIARIPAGETRTIDAWGSKSPSVNEVPTVEFLHRAMVAEKIRTATGSVVTL